MRYLVVSLFAGAMTLASAQTASATPRWWKHRAKPKPKPAQVAEVPELDASALPAALTLLGGATAVLVSRRRVIPKALP